MPDMDGYQVIKKLKGDKRTCDIPVIFLTGKTEEEDETEGFRLGAWDYITKPFSMPVVKARVQSVLNLKREMDRRFFLKNQMESLNLHLESQVRQKMEELREARQTLDLHEKRYHLLFEKTDKISNTRKKILIVDDNPENIHLLSDNLEEDYEILYATDGEDALETVFSGDRPDLILLDIMMPGLDGYEVCGRFKANADTWDIPIIFITAMNQVDDETRGLKLGAIDYISKPFSMSVVRARISTALRLQEEMDRRIMLTKQLRDMNQDLENRVSEKVTELRQAHEDLKESESRYRAIFENAVDGIFQVSLEGRILNASPSMARILGYDSSEELIASVTNIDTQCYVSPEDRKELLHLLTHDDVVKGFETRMTQKDGTVIWVSLSVRLVYDDQGEVIYTEGFCVDITGQKKAEMALRESEKRLRQAQKMEAIGTLASGIAHDFNNILFSMMGYSQMVFDSLVPESRERGFMENVIKAGQRAGELTRQILSFSRQTERERQPIRIKMIVKEVLKLISSLFPPNIEIKQEIQSSSLIYADPVEIHQVVMNLCTNSLHAMQDQGGILSVLLKDTEIPLNDTAAVKGLNSIHGPCVRLEVSDTGCGMSRENMERIFEPYFTTKLKGEGTGLGLATVYGIVKDMGGHISVESELGKGSSFFIDFPKIENINKTGQGLLPESSGLTGSEHILLVDDEEIICELLGHMLEKLGYRVSAYTSGKDALSAFKKQPEAFHLFITDIFMPEVNGLELIKEVIAVRPRIPLIILTGFSNPVEIEKARNLGVREFIRKPVIRNELAEAIRRAVADLSRS